MKTKVIEIYKEGRCVPEQPGLEHDFSREAVKPGHDEGMRVMGRFCIGLACRGWVRGVWRL